MYIKFTVSLYHFEFLITITPPYRIQAAILIKLKERLLPPIITIETTAMAAKTKAAGVGVRGIISGVKIKNYSALVIESNKI